MWRALVTTDIGREQWTFWEIMDTLYPYDHNVHVRIYNRRGVLLVWTKLATKDVLRLLANRLTRANKVIGFDDSTPPKLRDIISAIQRLIGNSRDFRIECEVRGGHLEIGKMELMKLLIEKFRFIGGIKKLLIEVVWDVVGLTILDREEKIIRFRH